MSEKEIIEIVYEFLFDDGRKHSFSLRIDAENLTLVGGRKGDGPVWTRLDYSKCPNCPLDAEKTEYCPLALNLVDIIEEFSDISSIEIAEIKVKTPERNFSRRLPVQKGLSSILGIYMTTSGCPILSKLKPMVRYHLPFASVEETVFRAVSTYLTGQYFVMKKGGVPDWNLVKLMVNYGEIEKVNEMMAHRLRSAAKKDSSVNAVVILDVFAKFVPLSIELSLKKLNYLFTDII
ncbi:MAG: hypothetical protein COT16_00350 [Elusimicrobia bacterium CG08_land_8_20_14_0_20_44_26]|nr:MAG: hypothetical protein COT16_00350 [Elusimicrobia bacterium CG08_land_8_20_14_0_20_44_26]